MDFAGGRLKLKGTSGVKKKTKKKRREGKDKGEAELVVQRADGKTEAERRFEQRQRKKVGGGQGRETKTNDKMGEEIRQKAGTTHKDRVAEFNRKLEAMSEHHDIPKVGPG